MAGVPLLAQRALDDQKGAQPGEDENHRGEDQLALGRVEIHRRGRYFRRRSGRSQNGAGPVGSSAPAPLPDAAEPPPGNTAGGVAWDAGVARGAAGGGGLRAGGAARGWAGGAGDERAGDGGAARDSARTGMAGGV